MPTTFALFRAIRSLELGGRVGIRDLREVACLSLRLLQLHDQCPYHQGLWRFSLGETTIELSFYNTLRQLALHLLPLPSRGEHA
jgi:hypothetical protein